MLQPLRNSKATTRAKAPARTAKRRDGNRSPESNSRAASASRASSGSGTTRGAIEGPPSGGSAAPFLVVTVTPNVAGVVPFRFRVEGDTLHVVVAGAPEQLRDAEPLKPVVPARLSE